MSMAWLGKVFSAIKFNGPYDFILEPRPGTAHPGLSKQTNQVPDMNMVF